MIIDCDSHITPRDAMAYLGSGLKSLTPEFIYNDRGHHIGTRFPERWFADNWGDVPGTTPVTIEGGTGGDYDGMYDAEARVADFSRLGIDRQVLIAQFTPWAWSYVLEPTLAVPMARSYNLSLLNILQRFPKQFIGAALMPLQDVAASIQEARWAKEHGFHCVVVDETFPVREHPFGEPLGTRDELWPFFQTCEALDIPVFLHRIQHGHRALNAPPFQKYGLDMFAPENVHLTLASFITSGLLDAYPGLKIIETETGTAWVKPLVEKMQLWYHRPPIAYIDEEPINRRRRLPARAHSLLADRELANERNQEEPLHYFRKNFWFTVETEEPELIDAVRYLGADRFLFATDYPHDDPGGQMKWKDVELLNSNSSLQAGEKELIFRRNAEALFGEA